MEQYLTGKQRTSQPPKCMWMMFLEFYPSSKVTHTEPQQPINLMIAATGQEPQHLKWLSKPAKAY